MSRVAVTSVFVLLLAGSAGAKPASRDPSVGDLNQVGDVRFANSCAAKVQPGLERAIALLHSFFYEEARNGFTAVAKDDPTCAIAQWGIAMTWYHPIWAPPTPAELKDGSAAIARASALSARATDREKAYIAALTTFYKDAVAAPPATTPAPQAGAPACHAPAAAAAADHPARAKAYEKAMEALHARFPDDLEGTVFYALSLLGAAAPIDATYANQKKAGAMLEPEFAKHPMHPGIAHYLIHAYDYPSLVEKALPAARHYAKIAPWVPHVLHMPSHTFSRLGLWQDSVTSNLAAAEMARAYAATHFPGEVSFEEFHALDYLTYSLLQLGQDKKAKEIVDRLTRIEKSHPAQDLAIAWAAAQIPARYALERHAWADAAKVEGKPAFWTAFPFVEAHLHFAHAIGSARTGDVAGARRAVAAIEALQVGMTQPMVKPFIKRVEVKRLAAAGWLAQAEGKTADAVKLLRQAADLEDTVGPHAVCPGSNLPVRELLGELLLETRQAPLALRELEASLKNYPHRFNGLLGAARAAAQVGKTDDARKYFAELVDIAKNADGERKELAELRAMLAAGKPKAK